ncbi:MAG: NAD(P)/FAD-dependent oxidoreductase [Proteobacteria bacterium]|nr:MAG: NAD(P)/FAD-dependent oxidoreductase [Pseudomonadota bacterium]
MANDIGTRVVILGGGFAGLYAAIELEKTIAKDPNVEVVLVNKDNFFLFTPMLHEVAASDLDPSNIVNPIHKLLRRVRFFCGSVDSVDLSAKKVVLSHGNEHHSHELEYDHLVISLGSVTNFYNLPGLKENALTMKSLGDAIYLRNQVIALLEEADFECCAHIRHRLLTFVVAGGGFAGVETIAAINDFVREVLKYYPNLREEHIRMVLVNAGKVILPELDAELGSYAQKLLASRGVEIYFEDKVKSYQGSIVELNSGTKFESCTLVWTAGTSPNPLLETLPCRRERGKVVVDEYFEVQGYPGVWALGDCAVVPDKTTGGFCPPTAQHALRQGVILARNIAATLKGKEKRPFVFKTLGQLAAIGRRRGVASVMGFRFSGFIAWLMWRGIYLMKLPRFEKKFRVALDWTLDILFSKDIVQFLTTHGAAMSSGEQVEEKVEGQALRLAAGVR